MDAGFVAVGAGACVVLNRSRFENARGPSHFVLGDSTLVLDTRARTRVIADRRLEHVQPALRECVRTAQRGTPEYSADETHSHTAAVTVHVG